MPDLFDGEITKLAAISPCEKYRWWLSRVWEPGKPTALFIMLNPSTADAEIDDPTIRRCIAFSRSWGCPGVAVVNLFSFRATEPADLKKATDPVGDLTGGIILGHASCRPVVAAWGVHGSYMGRDRAVCQMLARYPDLQLQCLGVTKDGHPKHPLYVPGNAKLIPYPVPEAS